MQVDDSSDAPHHLLCAWLKGSIKEDLRLINCAVFSDKWSSI